MRALGAAGCCGGTNLHFECVEVGRLALIMPDTASALSILHRMERSERQQERLRGLARCDRDG